MSCSKRRGGDPFADPQASRWARLPQMHVPPTRPSSRPGGAGDYLGELNRQRKVFPEGAPLQPRLALAAGIEQYRACARWARKAIKKFKEEGS